MWEKAFSIHEQIHECKYFLECCSQTSSFTPVLSHNHKDVEEHRRGMNEETQPFFCCRLIWLLRPHLPPRLSRCGVARYLSSLLHFLPTGRACLSQLTGRGGGIGPKKDDIKNGWPLLIYSFWGATGSVPALCQWNYASWRERRRRRRMEEHGYSGGEGGERVGLREIDR